MKKFRSKETYTQGTYGGAPGRVAVIFFFLLALLFSLPVQAQFFSTPNRHSTGDSKQSAQINQLQSENQQRLNENVAQDAAITTNATNITTVSNTTAAMKSCGDAGQLFGPAHTQAAGNCVGALTINADGGLSATAGLNVAAGVKIGNVITCDAAAEGTLRYNASNKKMELCDGAAWKGLGGAASCDYNYQGVVNADIDTYYTSDTPALSGFAGTQTATADGDATVTIFKNGADTGQKSVSVSNGDQIGFRVKASGNYSRVINLTMDIGSGFTSCWSVSTKDQDATPDAFTFNDLTNQDLSTTVTSNVVTLSGFDGTIQASISGQGIPRLRVNGGGWVTSANIQAGDTVQFQLTTSAEWETTYAASYQIGTSQGTWSAQTRPECNSGSNVWATYGVYSWAVPTGCKTLQIKLWGAGGHGALNCRGNCVGGGGGFTSATLAVSGTETLEILVGQGGASYTYEIGGGGRGASGGGGRSAIRLSGIELLTAGGGGGGGTDGRGGAGGGLSGQDGTGPSSYIGRGGSQTAGGAGPGGAGTAFQGGNAATQNAGAGGGGYFGGGGASEGGGADDAGGGGGSGYIGGAISGSTLMGSGQTPAGTGDPDYAGNAGMGGGHQQNGKHGRVVIYWSP